MEELREEGTGELDGGGELGEDHFIQALSSEHKMLRRQVHL